MWKNNNEDSPKDKWSYVYIHWIILLNIFFDDYNYRDSASSINLDLEELGFIKDEV